MLGWNRLYGSQIPDMKMEGMPDSVVNPDQPGMIEWVAGALGGMVASVAPLVWRVVNRIQIRRCANGI